ncbi:PREDICTED: prenylcysteine oxidase-like [Dinoponera quadriceps]|uniref:Prenylcysteine oxidase-like n=1 Tax=Dinoponera quadriceps TaxID=609295 RepID=A0A6P3XN69_DINQU|nr:PREDICTED: prenylcysteine oxidase-like [Dinoponera quadriceps]
MRKRIVLLIFGLLTLEHAICLDTRTPHVAVVGGGIGGASASHFLTELTKGNLAIDLYEAKRIGGRLATVKIGDNEHEAGGSILHPMNMYMQRFVKLLGLEHNLPTQDTQMFGIWDKDRFVYKSDSWTIVSLIKLVYRYGFQVFKLNRDIRDIIGHFEKIYELQDAGKSFENITALMSAINEEFLNCLQTSLKDRLLHMGYSRRLIDELAEAVVVVNYGQDIDVQSFTGLVSLAGTGADLWSVKGGNKRVPEGLIHGNKNINVMSGRVRKIRYIAESSDNARQYELTYTSKDNTYLTTAKYDIVIIAAPLTSDQEFPIEFADFPKDLEFPGSYQTTHATFVKADVKPKYFGLRQSLDFILSCNPNKTIISSLGKVDSVDGSDEVGSPIWKIFSRKPLETGLVHGIFSNVIEKTTVVWKAYPHYLSNTTTRHSFKLHDALYHINAIEWVASAMEMSAIGGRNVAILAYDDFLRKNSLVSHRETPKDGPKTPFEELYHCR